MIYLIIFYLIGFVIIWVFDKKSSSYNHPSYRDLLFRFFLCLFSWITIIIFIVCVIVPNFDLILDKFAPEWMKRL